MVKLVVSGLAVLLAFVLGLPLLVVAGAGARPAEPASLPVPAGGADARAEVVLAAARSVLGTPYVWGAASPSTGFDCSGLVQWAYRQAGVNLPRTTAEQIRSGIVVDPAELRPGDLVFSRGGRPVRDYGHVGIYVGDNKVIIAPHSGEVVSLRPLRPATAQAARRVLADQTTSEAR